MQRTISQEDESNEPFDFEVFYAKYQRFVYHVLSRMGGNYHNVADDLCQEVFIKVWRHVDQIKDFDHLLPWLGRVTWNVACDYVRKQQDRRKYQGEWNEDWAMELPEGSYVMDLITSGEAQAIAESFQALNQRDQDVLRILLTRGDTERSGAFRASVRRARTRFKKQYQKASA